MAASKLLLLALPVLAAAKAVLPRELFARDCTSNNCVRAVRGDNRPGIADCSSYLLRTVTPATSTITVTASLSFTRTTTSSSTSVDTVLTTVGVTDLRTTTSSTRTSTTTTSTSTGSWTGLPLVQEQKRQVTAAASTNFPAYASACTSFAKYSSACSCLGVTVPTTTLPTPLATVTVTASVTSTLSLATTTTSAVTSTRTETFTTTGVTVTTTDVDIATATASVPFRFRLRANSNSGASAGQYVKGYDAGAPYYFFNLSPNVADAWLFSLENGVLTAGSLGDQVINAAPANTYLFIDTSNSPGWQPVPCSVDSTSILQCHNTLYEVLRFCQNLNGIVLGGNNDCYDIFLKVVAAG